jgi:predicted transcriptional regulator of viral defense system
MVAEDLGIGVPHANKILSRLELKGWLQRTIRGTYILVPLASLSPETIPEDPWALAMELFSPCYISGFSAAEHWELTEQVFNTVVVYTAKPQRKAVQTVANVTFRTHVIPRTALFGTQRIWRNNKAIVVADIHRTVIDVLELPELGGGGRHTMDIVHAYWKSGGADPKILLDYAITRKRGVAFKRLGFTAEKWGGVDLGWIATCAQHHPKGISKLDPAGPDRGPIVSRWNVRVNVPLEEYQ